MSYDQLNLLNYSTVAASWMQAHSRDVRKHLHGIFQQVYRNASTRYKIFERPNHTCIVDVQNRFVETRQMSLRSRGYMQKRIDRTNHSGTKALQRHRLFSRGKIYFLQRLNLNIIRLYGDI